MKDVNEIRVIAWLMSIQLISRGLDYATGNPNDGHGVFPSVEFNPALMWGVACIVNALIVVVGLVAHNAVVARNGAVMCGITYASFAVMVVDDVFSGPFDDWRFLTSYVVACGVWLTLAWWLSVRIAVINSRNDDNESGDSLTHE